MADPRKPSYTPRFMSSNRGGSRADSILRSRRQSQDNLQDNLEEQERELERRQSSPIPQSSLAPKPSDYLRAQEVIEQKLKADEEARAKALEDQRAKQEAFRYVTDSDLQQEESRNQGNPMINFSNVNPSKAPLFKEFEEKSASAPRRPKPATPQDSQELELNERKYGIGSMSLLKDEDIQRQDDDIKQAQAQAQAETQAEAQRLKQAEDIQLLKKPEPTKGGKVDPVDKGKGYTVKDGKMVKDKSYIAPERASDPLADEERYGDAGYNVSSDYAKQLGMNASTDVFTVEKGSKAESLVTWAGNKAKYKEVFKNEKDKLSSLIEEEEKLLKETGGAGAPRKTVFAGGSPDADLLQDVPSLAGISKKDAKNIVTAEGLQKLKTPNIPPNIGGFGEEEILGYNNPKVDPKDQSVDKLTPSEADAIPMTWVDKNGFTRLTSDALVSALNTSNAYVIKSQREIDEIQADWEKDALQGQTAKRPPMMNEPLLARIREQFSLPDSEGLKTKNYGLTDKEYNEAVRLNYVTPWTPKTYDNVVKNKETITETTTVKSNPENQEVEVQTQLGTAMSKAINDNTTATLSSSSYTLPKEDITGGYQGLELDNSAKIPVREANKVIDEINKEDVKQIAFNIIDKEGHNTKLSPNDFDNIVIDKNGNPKPVQEWSFSNWDTSKSKSVKKGEYPKVLVYKADNNTWAKVNMETGVVNTVRTKDGENPPKKWKVPVSAIKLAKQNTPPHPNLPKGFIVLETQKKQPKNKKFNVRGKEGARGYTVGVTKGQVKFRTRGIAK
tara:strand:+ start:2885 stop:5239 length:2355 start_codon:yes stop_codon:yes gene_type:complete